MKTKENLKTAFAGESQAHFKYLAFAKIAEKEGHREVARLFRAAATAEEVHALSHFNVLGEAGDTEKNLMAAIDGETYEFTQMYPPFIEQAEQDNNVRATMTFKNACTVEKTHANLYSEALKHLGKNKDVEYHVCEICGHTHAGNAPDKCPVCGASMDKFQLVR